MTIDIKRLIGDAESLQASRKKQGASGTYAAIRDALPTIEAMRSNGIAWKTIAEALGLQGVTQKQGDVEVSITTSRLTSLVSDIKRQQVQAAIKLAIRRNSADLSKTDIKLERSKQFALADELTVKPHDANEIPDVDSEESIRSAQFEAMKGLFKQEN